MSLLYSKVVHHSDRCVNLSLGHDFLVAVYAACLDLQRFETAKEDSWTNTTTVSVTANIRCIPSVNGFTLHHLLTGVTLVGSLSVEEPPAKNKS